MSLTRPIPKRALPIVRELRRKVPIPDTLPEIYRYVLRWMTDRVYLYEGCNKLNICKRLTCPMGMHPLSARITPAAGMDFANSKFDTATVRCFYKWWDEQTDAQAAVNAVWKDPI